MKKHKLIALLLSISLVVALAGGTAVYASQTESSVTGSVQVTEENAAFFAKNEISRIVSESSPYCTWNDRTELYSPVALYDYNDNCIGYVFKLSTDNVETGYIQVNNFDGEFSVYAYSFTGIPAYEGLAIDNSGKVNRSNGKLYFFGNVSYCTKLDNGKFKPIDSPNEISAEVIATNYQSFVNQVRRQKSAYAAEKNKDVGITAKKAVSPKSSFTLVTTSDFSNLYATRPNGTRQKVTQHCSPTAATNIMLYFRSTGASALSSSLSNSNVFMGLYYAMDTNQISTSNTMEASGTKRSNIQPGIKSFCSDQSCSPASLGKVTRVDFTKIKNHINDGELLLASLNDFNGTQGGHSVVFFDYSGNDISIGTGWDTSYHWFSYTGLDINQFVYVGY